MSLRYTPPRPTTARVRSAVVCKTTARRLVSACPTR